MGLPQRGNIIYVDPEIARAEGVDIEHLVAYYRADGIRLITERPYWDDCEERWVCPGCKVGYDRDEENWRPSTLPGSDPWQPLCRLCEGTELDPKYRYHRERSRRVWETRQKKKPGRRAADPDNPVLSKARPAGEGRPAKWRFGQ
jgi:hypothetical protein